MSKNNEGNLSPQINELITKLEETKAQSDFCVTSFAGSTEMIVRELKSEREKVADHLKDLNASIKDFKESSTSLSSATRTLSVLPEKLDEKLSKLPKSFNSSIADTIPDLSKELIAYLEKDLNSLKYQAEALLNTTNCQMTSSLRTLKGNGDQIHFDMKHELGVYKTSMEEMLNRSLKSRINNFFWTVLISGGFSAFIAITTFWFIVRV